MIVNDVKLNKDESFDEYCHRISSDIRKVNNLTWQQVADIINDVWGLDHSESYYRKKESREYNSVSLDNLISNDDLINIVKEKSKLSDVRTQLNADIRRLSREETLKDIAHQAVHELETKKKLIYNKPVFNKYQSKSEALLLISDWHYGITIDNEFNVFNTDIAKIRVRELLDKTISKCDTLNIKTLHIANLGDMIAGNIHLPLRLKSRIDVITQVIEVSEILCEFINELSNKYNIKYYSVVDNHGRIDPNKKDSIQLENLCRIIDWYIKERLPQIEFNEKNLCSDVCNINILDYNIAFIHGHKDGKASVIRKLNSFAGTRFDLICSAHFHHFSSEEECGTMLISNGSLMGTDDYSYDLRLHANPSQTIIEISPYNVVEGIYKINLNPNNLVRIS